MEQFRARRKLIALLSIEFTLSAPRDFVM